MPEVGQLRPSDPSRLGDYEIVGRLGVGAQGVVFLARTEDREQRAVKLLHPDLAEDTEVRSRFLREAQVARQVARFCTAQIVDVDLAGDRPFVVTEYVDGPSLRTLVADEGPLSGGQLERLAIGMATALVAIHRAGVVHRDFKPANVLIGPDGPRVIDFGISRALDVSSTLSGGRAVGTPAYMSPEQLSGRDADPAMDVFAFGATLVFAATGAPPFGQDSIPAVMSRILTGEPDLGGLSGSLRGLAAACLDKDPARRPNAREALLALLGHDAALVRPENAPGEALAVLAAGGTGAGAVRDTGAAGGTGTAGNTGAGAAEKSVPPKPAERTSSGRRPSRVKARRAAIAALAALATAGCVIGAFWLATISDRNGTAGAGQGGNAVSPPASVLTSGSGSATATRSSARPTASPQAKSATPATGRLPPGGGQDDGPTKTATPPVEPGMLWTERGGVTISKDQPTYALHVWTEGGPVHWTATTSGPISAPAKGYLPADGRTDVTITKDAGAPDQGCGQMTITGEKNSRNFTLCWE
jgi:hypothetical protein